MDIKTLTPTKGHSIIQIREKPVEAGGLIIAGDQQNSAPVIGQIVRTSDDSRYPEGTEVVFRKYAIDTLNWVNDDGIDETLYILDNEEILAFISNQNDYGNNQKEQVIWRIESNIKEAGCKEASSKEEDGEEVEVVPNVQ